MSRPPQLNYFYAFDSEYAALADPVVGPLLFSVGTVFLNVWDVSIAQYADGFWLSIMQPSPLNPSLAIHPNLKFILNRDDLSTLGTESKAIVVNNMPYGIIRNLLVTTTNTAIVYVANGILEEIVSDHGVELRMDGGFELRQDYGLELRN